MRVTGGARKSKRLRYPLKGLRPTRNVVKQAIFNVLRPRLAGARVCDLFCGAGALGIEALSQGADSAVFVEQDRRTVRFLKENLKTSHSRNLARACHEAERDSNTRVIAGDVLRVLPRLAGEEFDIILADPPYEQGLGSMVLALIAQCNLLRSDGVVALEHSRRDKPVVPARLEVVKSYRYGDTMVSLFKREGACSVLTGRGHDSASCPQRYNDIGGNE